jgi:hypothetical protein
MLGLSDAGRHAAFVAREHFVVKVERRLPASRILFHETGVDPFGEIPRAVPTGRNKHLESPVLDDLSGFHSARGNKDGPQADQNEPK